MTDDPSSADGAAGEPLWYFVSDGTAEGPVDRADLLGLLARGELPRGTPVWNPELEDWTPAGDVEELVERLPPPVGAAAPAGSDTAGEGEDEGPDASERSVDLPLPELASPAGSEDEDAEAAGPDGPPPDWIPVAAGAVLVIVAGLAAWLFGMGPGRAPEGDTGAGAGEASAAALEERRREVARSHRAALTDSLERLPAADSLRAVHSEDGLEWTRRVAFAGLRRLPDESLVRHAQLMGEALSAAPVELCAAVAGWSASSEEYWRLLEGLPPDGMARLLEVFRAGAMAELRGRSPWPTPEADAVSSVFRMLGDRMTEMARDSLARILSPDASPAPEEACWADRRLYGGVTRLPDPWRAVLARALVTG